MIRAEKIIKEEIVERIFCDNCGLGLKFHELNICCKCGKDLCTNCTEHIVFSSDSGCEDAYCKSCWEIGEKHRNEIEKHQEAIDKLQEAWDDECRQKRKSLRCLKKQEQTEVLNTNLTLSKTIPVIKSKKSIRQNK